MANFYGQTENDANSFYKIFGDITIGRKHFSHNYLEAFIFLNSLLDFTLKVIMADFEKALRNSLGQVFPSVTIDGCYYHLCQAIRQCSSGCGIRTA